MKQKMKRIGFVVTKDQVSGSVSLPSAYATFIAHFGIPVPIFALDDHINTDIDLLILGGGADVDPIRYGQKPSYFAQNTNIQLEYFDRNILKQYVDANIPILGICRGFQTLNVFFGGSMDQHIKQAYSKSDDRGQLVHDVSFSAHYNSFADYFGIPKEGKNKVFRVNSLHHQGFGVNRVAENVAAILTNPVDSNVECLWVKNKPIVGVQWHPEETFDGFSLTLVRRLLAYDRNKA